MSSPTILHIDADDAVCTEVANLLGVEGFELVRARDGEGGLEQARSPKPDLILLELRLPGMNGFEVCRQIRGAMNVPIIMLTVKDNEVDCVVGLEMGADDYIGKPFSHRELVARIRAMLRRSALIKEAADRQKTLTFPGLQIDLPTRTVMVDGEESVHLTPKEFDLLYHLASQPRVVFSREQILLDVWGRPSSGADLRTVDTHVKRLRKKLQEGRGDQPWSLATFWGVGYKFDVAP